MNKESLYRLLELILQWEGQFNSQRLIVKSSLNWPNGLFDQLYGKERHRGVNHPKGLGELEVLREDM